MSKHKISAYDGAALAAAPTSHLLGSIYDLLAERLPEPSPTTDPAALASAEVALADAREDLAEVRRERDRAWTQIISLTGERDDLAERLHRLRVVLDGGDR